MRRSCCRNVTALLTLLNEMNFIPLIFMTNNAMMISEVEGIKGLWRMADK